MSEMTPETPRKLSEQLAERVYIDALAGMDEFIDGVAALESRIEELEAADETAWGIIANAKDWNVPDDGSPCGNMAKKWREAAIGWRDERHKRLATIAARRKP